MDKIQATFQFIDYKINSIKYSHNPDFNYIEPIDVQCKFTMELAVNEEDSKGKLTIILFVFENAEKNNYPFSLEISISGFFTSVTNLSQEEFIKLLKVNGAAVLFPFLRSTVADVTKTANIKTLILPLFNFTKMIEDQESNN